MMRLIAVVALIVLVFPFVPGLPPSWIVLAANIGLGSLVTIGLVLLTGVGGMTSFAQAAFVGFGAYTTAVLTVDYQVSPWLTLPASLLVTALGALIIGLITIRLSGHYLPLGTLAWGVCAFYLFGSLPFLGMHTGISGIPPLSVGDYQLIDPLSSYFLIWAIVILAVIATLNLLDSRYGRAIRTLRGGGIVAQSFGIRTMRVKLFVFVYAALLAGLSGWLYAHFQRSVSPGPFGLNAGIEYLLMAVVGGAGHVFGALIGSAIITILREQLQLILPHFLGRDGNFEMILFGIILVALLQVSRGGLWPLIAGLFPAFVHSAQRDAAATEMPAQERRKTASPGDTLLVVENLHKRFGGLTAVNDVSFDIKAGEIVGLIGPNGAGKSTTFNMLTGLVLPSAGNIRFDGKDITGRRPEVAAEQGIGRTFQHAHIVADMSVLDSVLVGTHLRGRSGPVAAVLRLKRNEEQQLRHEAMREIDRVGLGERSNQRADSLPLGQLRLLEIARAVALDPILLLLDEPAAGLRHQERLALIALLKRLRSDGMAVLLVEHDMNFINSLADRIVVLDFGSKIAEGSPAAIRNDPAVRNAYLGMSQ